MASYLISIFISGGLILQVQQTLHKTAENWDLKNVFLPRTRKQKGSHPIQTE